MGVGGGAAHGCVGIGVSDCLCACTRSGRVKNAG